MKPFSFSESFQANCISHSLVFTVKTNCQSDSRMYPRGLSKNTLKSTYSTSWVSSKCFSRKCRSSTRLIASCNHSGTLLKYLEVHMEEIVVSLNPCQLSLRLRLNCGSRSCTRCKVKRQHCLSWIWFLYSCGRPSIGFAAFLHRMHLRRKCLITLVSGVARNLLRRNLSNSYILTFHIVNQLGFSSDFNSRFERIQWKLLKRWRRFSNRLLYGK